MTRPPCPLYKREVFHPPIGLEYCCDSNSINSNNCNTNNTNSSSSYSSCSNNNSRNNKNNNNNNRTRWMACYRLPPACYI